MWTSVSPCRLVIAEAIVGKGQYLKRVDIKGGDLELTLVHFSAQLEPCLTHTKHPTHHKHPLNTP